MYSVKKATKEIDGMVDLTMNNTKENAVELAAAWGLYASRAMRESYSLQGNQITFRFTDRTFSMWLDIVRTVKEK